MIRLFVFRLLFKLGVKRLNRKQNISIIINVLKWLSEGGGGSFLVKLICFWSSYFEFIKKSRIIDDNNSNNDIDNYTYKTKGTVALIDEASSILYEIENILFSIREENVLSEFDKKLGSFNRKRVLISNVVFVEYLSVIRLDIIFLLTRFSVYQAPFLTNHSLNGGDAHLKKKLIDVLKENLDNCTNSLRNKLLEKYWDPYFLKNRIQPFFMNGINYLERDKDCYSFKSNFECRVSSNLFNLPSIAPLSTECNYRESIYVRPCYSKITASRLQEEFKSFSNEDFAITNDKNFNFILWKFIDYDWLIFDYITLTVESTNTEITRRRLNNAIIFAYKNNRLDIFYFEVIFEYLIKYSDFDSVISYLGQLNTYLNRVQVDIDTSPEIYSDFLRKQLGLNNFKYDLNIIALDKIFVSLERSKGQTSDWWGSQKLLRLMLHNFYKSNLSHVEVLEKISFYDNENQFFTLIYNQESNSKFYSTIDPENVIIINRNGWEGKFYEVKFKQSWNGFLFDTKGMFIPANAAAYYFIEITENSFIIGKFDDEFILRRNLNSEQKFIKSN